MVSLLPRRVFISPSECGHHCVRKTKLRGPCAGARCKAQLLRASHCWGSDASALSSFSPPPTPLEFSQFLLKPLELERQLFKKGVGVQGRVPTPPWPRCPASRRLLCGGLV